MNIQKINLLLWTNLQLFMFGMNQIEVVTTCCYCTITYHYVYKHATFSVIWLLWVWYNNDHNIDGSPRGSWCMTCMTIQFVMIQACQVWSGKQLLFPDLWLVDINFPLLSLVEIDIFHNWLQLLLHNRSLKLTIIM